MQAGDVATATERAFARSRFIAGFVGILALVVCLPFVGFGDEEIDEPNVPQTLYLLALEAGYAEDEAATLMTTADLMIANEIPPGTILQVSKSLLSSTTSADLLLVLAELQARIASGEPPGQVANSLLGRGNARLGKSNNRGTDDEDTGGGDEDGDVGETGEGNGKGKDNGKGKK